MQVGAIIAEFNPLHQGHLYLIQEAKKDCDLLIVLLSGYFSQRGEPVCQDKWLRAKDTIEAGADLVLTHPVYSATSPAQEFAEGAVSIITRLPYIHSLYFGMEQSGLEVYFEGLHTLENNMDYRQALREHLNQGYSYSVSIREALAEVNPNLVNLFQPNTILGLEYGRSLHKRNLLHLAKPIPRLNYIEGMPLPSASKLRAEHNQDHFHESSVFQYNGSHMNNTEVLEDELYQVYRGHLLSDSLDFSRFLGYEVGIEARLKSQSVEATRSKLFFQKAKTKRYSVPRLKRLLLHSYLNITRDDIHSLSQHELAVQVLAFNSKGRAYLRECQEDPSLSLITNYRQIDNLSSKAQNIFKMEIKASNLYHLLTRSSLNQDMLRHPYIKKS